MLLQLLWPEWTAVEENKNKRSAWGQVHRCWWWCHPRAQEWQVLELSKRLRYEDQFRYERSYPGALPGITMRPRGRWQVPLNELFIAMRRTGNTTGFWNCICQLSRHQKPFLVSSFGLVSADHVTWSCRVATRKGALHFHHLQRANEFLEITNTSGTQHSTNKQPTILE